MLYANFQEVCYQYWPNTGTFKIGEYTVELQREERKEGFILRYINIQPKKVRRVCPSYPAF